MTSEWQVSIARFVERAYAALDSVDYYRILGVSSAATEPQIRDAYYKLAAQLHPDVHGLELEPDYRQRLTAVFSRVVEAYRALTDPRARAAYDRGLARGLLRLRAGAEQSEARPEDSIDDPGALKFYKLGQAALEGGDARSAIMNLRLALSMAPDSSAIKDALALAEKARG